MSALGAILLCYATKGSAALNGVSYSILMFGANGWVRVLGKRKLVSTREMGDTWNIRVVNGTNRDSNKVLLELGEWCEIFIRDADRDEVFCHLILAPFIPSPSLLTAGVWVIESYPTMVRTSVGGVANLAWQVAGVITPLIGGALLAEKGNDGNTRAMMWIYSVVFLLGLIAPILIVTDTTHKALEDTVYEENGDLHADL